MKGFIMKQLASILKNTKVKDKKKKGQETDLLH